MKRMLIMALVTVAVSSPTFGQGTGTGRISGAEQEALQVSKEWIEAEGRHDRAVLDRIIAADFEGTGPAGNAVTKDDIVPSDGSQAGGISMTGQDLRAHVFGDTAVVTGRGLPQGEEKELRFTLVYIKRQSRWQMVAAHLSGVPRPSPRCLTVNGAGLARRKHLARGRNFHLTGRCCFALPVSVPKSFRLCPES